MKINEFFIDLSYSPVLIRLIRFLHLRDIARSIYYRLFSPRARVITVENNGAKGLFYARTPLEFRGAGVLLRKKHLGEVAVIEKIIGQLAKGSIVYDIGASIGVHTVFLALYLGSNGKVVAFEPEKKSYQSLLDNIRLNNLNNVTAMNLALGEEETEGKLYWREGITGSYSLSGNFSDSIVADKVKIIPGDLFIKGSGIPFPEAVKIDVEGYEYQVIKGMLGVLSDKRCHVVCCEIHPKMLPKGVDCHMVVNLLKSCGFTDFDYPFSKNTFNLFCRKR